VVVMGWDVNYEHQINKIGNISNNSNNTEEKWKIYYAFQQTQLTKIKAADNPFQLTEEEKREIEKLRSIDRKVRSHEMAHVIVGGPYIKGGPYYKYVTGPDGKRYAVAGEVKIDVSEEKDPEKTIKKMQIVRRAALAPADPSPTDRRIAAEASAKEAKARAKLMEKKLKEFRKRFKNKNTSKLNKGEQQYIYNIFINSNPEKHNYINENSPDNTPTYTDLDTKSNNQY